MRMTSGEIKAAAKKARENLIKSGVIRPTLPTIKQIHETVKVPKIREEVPLHLYLVEQPKHKTVADESEQTDIFLEEKEAPEYIPRKTGVDTASQVETPYVFVYDVDVQPILEVIVSKTLTQSLMEVREEEDLKTMYELKAELERKFDREEQERTLKLELERELVHKKTVHISHAQETRAKELALQQKIAAGAYARAHIDGLELKVLTNLRDENFFVDARREAALDFMAGTAAKVQAKVARISVGHALVEDLLSRASLKLRSERSKELARRLQRLQKHDEGYYEAQRVLAAERAEAARVAALLRTPLKLHLQAEGLKPVGPIALVGASTVQDVEEKVREWIASNVDPPPSLTFLKFVWNGAYLEGSK
jgi:hypothetical protein